MYDFILIDTYCIYIYIYMFLPQVPPALHAVFQQGPNACMSQTTFGYKIQKGVVCVSSRWNRCLPLLVAEPGGSGRQAPALGGAVWFFGENPHRCHGVFDQHIF